MPDRLLRKRAEAELGLSLLEQGRIVEAAPLLRASLAGYQALSNQVSAMEVAHVRVYVAVLDFQLGRVEDASQRFLEARKTLATHLGAYLPDVSAATTTSRVSPSRVVTCLAPRNTPGTYWSRRSEFLVATTPRSPSPATVWVS